MRTLLAAAVLAITAGVAAADPRPPLDPDDVFIRDDGLACWAVPTAGGCNAYGCWADGGGCNAYGCWNSSSGACNAYGCSDAGACTAYGCPEGRGRRARGELECSAPDDVPVGDSGCNAYGCWSNGGGCNAYGCWNSAYGACNAYGCADVGECNAYGCPPAPASHRARHHRRRR